MAHGLSKFDAQDLIDKSQSALDLIESALTKEDDAHPEIAQEALRIVLENQMRIVRTLDLIKLEFDKFEEGLGKIL